MLNQILLIDDDELNNFINEKMIRLYGGAKDIKVAISAEDGIHFLESSCIQQRNKPPELILLDISMPRQDGFDFINIFNKLKLKKEEITIAILTSSEDERDIRKVKAMGIEHYLVKPLDNKSLMALIEKIQNLNNISMIA
jgi:response regulator of citrate/malate metabolism